MWRIALVMCVSFASILSAVWWPHSTLGASGAISGVMGAYMVLFPRNKVNALILYFMVSIPAVFVIGMWALTQFVSGAGSIAEAGQAGGVAYMAHIGGFVAGVVMGLICRMQMKEEPDSAIRRGYVRDQTVKRWW
jgi:membrane associated rhomboid family serine protease